MTTQHNRVLALDIGGTKIAAGLVDLATFSVVAHHIEPAPSDQGGSAVYDAILALARQLEPNPHRVGVCYGGHIAGGRIVRSNQVTGWDDFPLIERLKSDLLADDVRIENDANAIGLAEFHSRRAQGLQSLIYLTVSTGIGGALLLNGQLVHGAHHLAGELGHIIADATSGVVCNCGRVGCLEILAAGPAISRHYAKATHHAIPAIEIALRARSGDADAINALTQSARYVGQVLGTVNAMLDADLIVIGGGVSRAGDIWWQTLRESFASADLPWRPSPSVIQSTLGTAEGLLGAAALFS